MNNTENNHEDIQHHWSMKIARVIFAIATLSLLFGGMEQADNPTTKYGLQALIGFYILYLLVASYPAMKRFVTNFRQWVDKRAE